MGLADAYVFELGADNASDLCNSSDNLGETSIKVPAEAQNGFVEVILYGPVMVY